MQKIGTRNDKIDTNKLTTKIFCKLPSWTYLFKITFKLRGADCNKAKVTSIKNGMSCWVEP